MATSKPIALALQGGGAHGAFTWGVLDKLLEDGRLDIKAITGTSAGAMNAAVLAQGFTQSGRDGARETLERFWHALSIMGQASPIKRSFADMLTGNWSLDATPAYNMLDIMSSTLKRSAVAVISTCSCQPPMCVTARSRCLTGPISLLIC